MPGLFGTNPSLAGIDSYLDPRRGQLLALAAGLSSSPDFGQALSNGFAGAAQARPADTAYIASKAADAARQQQINQTAAWVKKNYPQFGDLPPEQGFQLAAQLQAKTEAASIPQTDPADVATYKFYANQELQGGRQPKSFADWFAGSRQAAKGSLGPPLSFVDPVTKQIHPVQKFTDGSTIDLTTGQPPDPSLTYDPSATAQATAGGAAFGTQQGTQQFNIPAAKQNVDLELANIDAILNDKVGMAQTFGNVGGVSVNGIGFPNQWTPELPNTPRANLHERVKQVVGQNFLQAYSSLKGAGAITEAEGSKAQEAMARLGSAQDQASFETALNDLKAVLKMGYDRMGTQAGSTYQPNGFQAPPLGADPVSAADQLLKSGKY